MQMPKQFASLVMMMIYFEIASLDAMNSLDKLPLK